MTCGRAEGRVAWSCPRGSRSAQQSEPQSIAGEHLVVHSEVCRGASQSNPPIVEARSEEERKLDEPELLGCSLQVGRSGDRPCLEAPGGGTRGRCGESKKPERTEEETR